MNNKNWAFLVFFLVIFVAFLAPSCGKKEISSKPVMSEEEARRQAEEEARRREMEKQAAIQEETIRDERLSESEKMVAALKKFGHPNPKLTVYPEARHDSWTKTYDNPELYQWFLKHRR